MIIKSNGYKQTITPAMREHMASMQRNYVEETRLANASGKSKARTQIRTMLICPYGMPSCNRKSNACGQCRAELGLPAREYNRAPTKSALMLASRKLASRGSAGAGSSSDA